MAPHFPEDCKVVSLVKGFHLDETNASFLRISTLISKSLKIPIEGVCSLSGPNVYQEIASNYAETNRMRRPCNAVVSSFNPSTAREFQEMYFAEGILRTYYSDDIVASEVCGALKNVYAIAAGASDGHHAGNGMGINFKASLLTRSAYELSYFVRALGGRPENVYGLAGIGDMIATCTRGRNWEAGRRIITGKPASQVEEEMRPNVLEGLQTLRVVNSWLRLLRRSNPALCLELPIFEATYRFVYEGLDFEEGVEQVINRPMKKEMRMDPYVAAESEKREAGKGKNG
jgi:glycerol-3-phosphate dehydrogenase (NAD(P)+)